VRTLFGFRDQQVFLNYPFDEAAEHISSAMHFGVIAGGLLPVCASDLTVPDRPRLEMLIEVITSCRFSAHDFSRCQGEGEQNLARFNMPIEMGMALFHALQTQRRDHRCAFFVPSPNHAYQKFASDLAGLDPLRYEDENTLLVCLYGWLLNLEAVVFPRPPTRIVDLYREYKHGQDLLRGSGRDGSPSHHERQELMYQVCSKAGLWDWRENSAGRQAFPPVPLAWKEEPTEPTDPAGQTNA